jgi:hypothetical protein
VSQYILGFALALLTIAPVLSIGGVRVAYALVLLLALWRVIAMNVKIPRTALFMLLWLIPLIYALLIDSFRVGQEGLSLFARGALTLLGAFLLLTDCRDVASLRRAMLGAAPVVAANSVVAILQYFGSAEAIILGALVSGAEGAEAARESMEVGSLRATGLQGASHVFAYIMGVWAFLYSWVVIRDREFSIANVVIGLVALVALGAATMSAQRSVVWLLVPCVFVLLFLRVPNASRLLVGSIAGVFILFVVGSAELLSESGVLARLANFSGTSGDIERQQTWRHAWLIISEDPFFGRAFGSYDFGRGIHNGFLNGWARYGMVWLLFVLAGLTAYVYAILSKRGNLLDQFAGGVLFLLVLANAMFHTTAPAIGDMVVFIAFAFGLSYTSGLTARSSGTHV